MIWNAAIANEADVPDATVIEKVIDRMLLAVPSNRQNLYDTDMLGGGYHIYVHMYVYMTFASTTAPVLFAQASWIGFCRFPGSLTLCPLTLGSSLALLIAPAIFSLPSWLGSALDFALDS